MTELCAYEFEDTVWNEFCQSDDHIVPHPGFKRFGTHYILPYSCKKSRYEVTGASSDIGDRSSASYVDQEQRPGIFPYLKESRNAMLEKDPWSQTRSAFPSSGCDSMKEELSTASGNTRSSPQGFRSNNRVSNGNEFCAEDTILGEKNAEVDNSSFSYPLGDITQADNSLDFFNNAEDEDSSNFLCYGWPEIGNFEDVDRMFRSCDSTFGLGASKDNDLAWFSAADDITGPGNVLNSEIKYPGSNSVENISENHDKKFSVSDSAMTNEGIKYKDGSWVTAKSDSSMSFRNKSATGDSSYGFQAEEQEVRVSGKNQRQTGSGRMMDEHKKQVKLRNQFVGRRKENYFGNGSFNYLGNMPNEAMRLSSEANSHRSTQSAHLQQLAPDHIPDYAYLQKNMSCQNSDNCHLSDPSMINQPLCAVKSEANGLKSVSLKDSSPSSQLQSSIPSFPDVATPKRETVQNHRDSPISNVNVKSSSDPGLIRKQVEFSGDKFDNHGDVGGVGKIMPGELGPANIQESSTMISGLDDISLEVSSFRQFQLVTEKLDLRTKLCIRDSLYRLARNAEQRHNNTNLSGFGDEKDPSGPFMVDGTNNFMDTETDTNPIDRSIAHLLFHRPSESPSGVHGSVTSHVKVENLVTHEETTPDIEKVSGH